MEDENALGNTKSEDKESSKRRRLEEAPNIAEADPQEGDYSYEYNQEGLRRWSEGENLGFNFINPIQSMEICDSIGLGNQGDCAEFPEISSFKIPLEYIKTETSKRRHSESSSCSENVLVEDDSHRQATTPPQSELEPYFGWDDEGFDDANRILSQEEYDMWIAKLRSLHAEFDNVPPRQSDRFESTAKIEEGPYLDFVTGCCRRAHFENVLGGEGATIFITGGEGTSGRADVLTVQSDIEMPRPGVSPKRNPAKMNKMSDMEKLNYLLDVQRHSADQDEIKDSIFRVEELLQTMGQRPSTSGQQTHARAAQQNPGRICTSPACGAPKKESSDSDISEDEGAACCKIEKPPVLIKRLFNRLVERNLQNKSESRSSQPSTSGVIFKPKAAPAKCEPDLTKDCKNVLPQPSTSGMYLLPKLPAQQKESLTKKSDCGCTVKAESIGQPLRDVKKVEKLPPRGSPVIVDEISLLLPGDDEYTGGIQDEPNKYDHDFENLEFLKMLNQREINMPLEDGNWTFEEFTEAFKALDKPTETSQQDKGEGEIQQSPPQEDPSDTSEKNDDKMEEVPPDELLLDAEPDNGV